MPGLRAIAKQTGFVALSLCLAWAIQSQAGVRAEDNGGSGTDAAADKSVPAGETPPAQENSGSVSDSPPASSPASAEPARDGPADSSHTEGSPEAQAEEQAQSAPSDIPNADAMADTKRTFGASEIPGYAEAMETARDPSQMKGNKQLIESLRDVFPVNGNPLKDLFTPQPQYVTPQTLMNPQPELPKPGQANPLKGLFTPQPQYITPRTLMNPEPAPAEGEINHFKGLFTAQPQYVTPQTIMNPHALPRYYVKERLPDHFFVKDAPAKEKSEDKGETPLGPSRPTDNSGSAHSHPLRQAMLLINSAHEADAIALVDRLLVQYPGNFQARYVKAVALVRLRRFGEAREEYKTIMQFSSDPALKKLSQEGMTKLDQ